MKEYKVYYTCFCADAYICEFCSLMKLLGELEGFNWELIKEGKE